MKNQLRIVRLNILIGFGAIIVLAIRTMKNFEIILLLLGIVVIGIGLELIIRNIEQIIQKMSIIEGANVDNASTDNK